MKVVVSGATGFLGNNLVRKLVDLGFDVTCIKRSGSSSKFLADCKLTWVEDDFKDPGILTELLADAAVMYHCAAKVGTANKATAAMVKANVDVTRTVLAAHEVQNHCRLVHCSTIATCAVSHDGRNVTEKDHWNFDKYGMNSGYTVTKRMAENLVLDGARRGLAAVVVNPCYMFGPGDASFSSCRMILDICNGKIPAYPGGGNNFVDVRDVAAGMILAAAKGRPGSRYILGGENLSYQQVFDKIARIANVKPVSKKMPVFLGKVFGLLGDAKEYVTGRDSLLNSTGIAWSFANCRYSSQKAIDELGYSAGSIDEAIEAACLWFAENGYLELSR
ncbi:MAG: NAD-dependent epimerase/dehydratase family protein [Porticoccaceae bacterium]|nr:NAD-dependent epimerase/dehydratase family protein [Porticoccaceae bacterium]